MTRLIKSSIALALAAAVLGGFPAAPSVQAAPVVSTHGKKIAAKSVYVCKDCHAYYSPTAAKKMGYKDGMGHKLVKAAKVPAGFMDGSKMTM